MKACEGILNDFKTAYAVQRAVAEQKGEPTGGIEVPDARFKAWFPVLNKYLVVADCVVGGYIIHGTPEDGTKLKLEDHLRIHVDLLKDGKVIKSGDSTEVLDQPIHALKWLVEALAKRGRKLTAGQIVSTGTFFVPPKLEKGEYIARYTGAITEDVKLSVR